MGKITDRPAQDYSCRAWLSTEAGQIEAECCHSAHNLLA